MRIATRHRTLPPRGFTFAEALAAMVFVAIVLPTALHGIMIATRAGEVAERRRTAAFLADRLLSEWAATEEWLLSDGEGDFDEDWPGYTWAMETETWTDEAMMLLTAEVFFPVRGREYSVRVSTVVPSGEETA
jgi:Tfp pilus assembly protein PilV